MEKRNGQTGIFDPQPLQHGLRRRGISADELAREVGADERTIYKALRGGVVNLKKLAKICNALEVAGIRFLGE